MEIVALIVSVAAALVALSSAFYTRTQAVETSRLRRIERDRRHDELCPQLRVTCESWGSGVDLLRLKVMLFGPPGLDRVDSLTVTIRDDHFRRGEGVLLAGGPTKEQIKEQIWGPYRFAPGVGPDGFYADRAGRVIVYGTSVPIGEELSFQLEHTGRPPWATATSSEDWWRERGSVIRLAFLAEHQQHDPWTLSAEMDIGDGRKPVMVTVPQK